MESVHSLFEENNIVYIHVPGGCTDRLQPLDPSVNKSVKSFLREKFSLWYADQVRQQLDAGREASDVRVSMQLAQMKELSVQWLEDVYVFMQKNKDIAINGFKKAGIQEAIANPPVPTPESDSDPFVE